MAISAAYWSEPIVGIVSQANETPLSLGRDDYVAAVNCDLGDTYTFQSTVDMRIDGGVYNITDAKRSAVRTTIFSPPLPEGRYEVRVRRTSPNSDSDLIMDEVTLNEVAEVINDDVAHINTALLAVRIKMDEQISGLPKVTAAVDGRVIGIYDRAAGAWRQGPSSNPAWITLDALTNPNYGGGLLGSRIDFDKLLEWAEFCDANKLTFNGVIDGESNLWDATKLFLRAGRAQIVRMGTRMTFAIERAADPVMVFNTSNIVEGSFSQEWVGAADRANEIELTYYPADDDFKARTIRVVDEAAIARGEPQRTSAVTMFGITNDEQAYREAWLMLNMNRYLRQTVRFSAHLDAIACTVGDVILVQHDQPAWGEGGKLEAGSTTTVVNLDRPVTIEAGTQYKLMVVFPALQVGTATVLSIAGSNVVLSGTPTKATRIVLGGLEQQIRGQTVIDGSSYLVSLSELPAGLQVGATAQLWRTDVIEERNVFAPAAGQYATLSLASPLPAAPSQFFSWVIGSVKGQRKPFRIQSISGTGMEEREIVALEYNETIYTASPMPTPNYSGLTNAVQQTTISSVREELQKIGTVLKSLVVVEFSNPSPNYAYSEVQVSTNGSPWKNVGKGLTKVTFDAEEGQKLQIRAIAYSMLGQSARPESAQVRQIEVQGKRLPPADVTGLTVRVRQTDLVVEWEPNKEADIAGYEIREGASWDGGRVILSNYAGTMHVTDKSEAGTYYFHAKAIDTSGNYSEHVTTYKLVLVEPRPVRDFVAVQSGDQIVFDWRQNEERDIAGYEIREGSEWAISELVATAITNNRYSLPVAGNKLRRFLIKSIAAPGIYSATATYVDVNVQDQQTRNVVLSYDHEALGYSGTLINMNRTGKGIEMVNKVGYGEYSFPIVMPKPIRARNHSSFSLLATKSDFETWDSAVWRWDSVEAGRSWEMSGDTTSVFASVQIATKLTQPRMDGYVDRWSFNNSPLSFRAAAPTRNIGVKYSQGRFGAGLALSQFVDVQYSTAIPAVFSLKFWYRPKFEDGVRKLWWASGPSGSLELLYRPDGDQFELVDGRRSTKVVMPAGLANDEVSLIVVYQSATHRGIRLGVPGGTVNRHASEVAQPIGAFTSHGFA